MSLFRRIVSGGEQRSQQEDPRIPPRNSEIASTDSGEWVTERSALQLIAVQACVRLLVHSIPSLPFGAYRHDSDIRRRFSPSSALIADPVPAMNELEWNFQMVTSLALRGNSFHLVVGRDRHEYATELLPLHPDEVAVAPDPDTGEPVYRVNGTRVPTADVLHIKRFVLPGWLEGLSPIGAARQSIGLGLAAERYGARYFADSANPSAVLRTDENLTAEQAHRTMKSWVDTHGGRRVPALLSGGLQYQQISIAPGEAQFLETRQFQRGEIAMLYGIPPHMIGDTAKSTSWGTGIEQQSIGFAQYTLRPWLSCIEAAMTKLLPRGQFARFNIDALLRGDQKARYEAYTQARMASWLSVNEIRALEDRPPVENGDSYIQPLNYGPLGSDPLADDSPDQIEGQEEGDDETQ